MKYNAQNNKAVKVLREEKSKYEGKLIRNYKKNPKPFHRYMRLKQNTKATVRQLSKEDGSLTSSDAEAAELLQEFFTSVFTIEDITTAPDLQVKELSNEIENMLISKLEVIKALQKLQENKAPGVDGIHPKVLKRCCESLAFPLQLIFQKTPDEGHLPRDWRDANVTAVHKMGSKAEVGNYRPVSLTSVPCKVLESLVKSRMLQHLKDNNLLSDHQHGFTANRSCLTNLLTTLEMVTKAVDDGDCVDMIYFDYKKAFDKVAHHRLICKLKSFCFQGNLMQWIEGFLSDRRQRVVINGAKSAWSNVTSGVPQGSVIGPILFLLFVSDITDEVHSYMILFADDTKLYRRIISDEDGHILQRDIDVLHAWSQIWLMEFNIGKCKSLHYGYGNAMREYTIDNEILQRTDEEKDLGVLMSASLKPSSQCAAVQPAKLCQHYTDHGVHLSISMRNLSRYCTKLTYGPILNFVYLLGAHTCQKISK